MGAVVLDTHAAIWYLLDQQSLSPDANYVIEEAVNAGDPLYLSAVSLVEVIYLVEKNRLSSRAHERMIEALHLSNAALVGVPVTIDICETLVQIRRSDVPDMPDRIIAATALNLDLPLITRDRKIRASQVRSIW